MTLKDTVCTRRAFSLGLAWAAAAAATGLAGRALADEKVEGAGADGLDGRDDALSPLPPAQPSPDNEFGVDVNVNVHTIDDLLGRPDTVYRDMRMIFDPAQWETLEDVDGDPYISQVLEGFKIVPYPFLATMGPIPVEGAYDGETLFDVEWDEDGEIVSVNGNYAESMRLLRELFPRDKNVVLVCGGAGYASFTKKLLVYLGWDASRVYNAGGMWFYDGDRAIELIDYGATAEKDVYMLWRADYTIVDFTLMRPERTHYQRANKQEDAR